MTMWMFLAVTVVELIILYFVGLYVVKALHRLNQKIDARKAAEAAAGATATPTTEATERPAG